MVDINEKSFWSLYKEQNNSLLNNIEPKIIAFENQAYTSEQKYEISRILHTIKGASAALNVHFIVLWIDLMEDYWENITANSQIESPEIDYFLASIDWLKKLIDMAMIENETPSFFDELIKKFENGENIVEEIEQIPEQVVTESVQNNQVISTGVLDNLLNLSGELYVKSFALEDLKISLSKLIKKIPEGLKSDMEFSREIKNIFNHSDDLDIQFRRVTNQLNESIINIRMVPLSELFLHHPRMVRELSKSLEKKVEWSSEGDDIRVDKSIVEKLKGPFDHLIRNSMDHGIESPNDREKAGKNPVGKIKIKAFQQGDHVVVEFSDDGNGIDLKSIKRKILDIGQIGQDQIDKLTEEELMEFIFIPEFSTRDNSNLTSGRGIGMDVVKSEIDKMNGKIIVNSELGKGTTFSFTLPTNLAITHSILMESCGITYAFPMGDVLEYISVYPRDLKSVGGSNVLKLKDRSTSTYWLQDIFELDVAEEILDDKSYPALVFKGKNEKIALIGERFLGQTEIIIRPFDQRLKYVENLMGMTILSNGSLAQVVNVDDIIHNIHYSQSRARSKDVDTIKSEEVIRKKSILVVEDSITVRELEKTILKKHGYDVEVAVDGKDAINVLNEGEFDLIITDIDMPRMGGIELINFLRGSEKWKSVPIIIVSYKDRQEDREKGLKAGANHFISKGQFEDDDFLKVLRKLV